jgi:hypothetical protein
MTMRLGNSFFSTWLSLCLFCLFGYSSSQAASPRDEILRLVPDDAGLCLLIQDLRDQLDRLHRSPFAARLAKTSIGRSLISAPETKQLAAFEQQLTTHFQITWAQLRDDILGDAIVIAYTPGPPERPDGEQGFMILHARKPERLAALLDRLNEVQKQSGELLAAESRQFGGQPYVRRQKKDGEEFYCLRGQLLVFSESESQLQKVIQRDLERPTVDREQPTQSRRLQSLGIEQNLFAVWLNPRAFDAALKPKVDSARGSDASILRTFFQSWSAIDAAAITVRLDRDLSISLAVQVRPDALPPSLRQVLVESRRPAAVWSAFPSNAMFAAAGRVPWEPAVDTGRDALPPEKRKFLQDALERSVGAIIGHDLLPQLLRLIGPEWGVCIAPPEDGSKVWLPSFTGAIQLRTNGDSSIKKRVLNGLDVFVGLVVVSVNSQHATRFQMRPIMQGDVEVRVIDGERFMPPGLQPAFAWKDNYLVFGSSPEAILRFKSPSGTDPVATSDEVPIVRLALAGWANYLRNYREPLATFAAGSHHLDIADVQRRLDKLLEALDLFDKVEVTQRTQGDRATLTLRLRMVESLRAETKNPTDLPGDRSNSGAGTEKRP